MKSFPDPRIALQKAVWWVQLSSLTWHRSICKIMGCYLDALGKSICQINSPSEFYKLPRGGSVNSQKCFTPLVKWLVLVTFSRHGKKVYVKKRKSAFWRHGLLFPKTGGIFQFTYVKNSQYTLKTNNRIRSTFSDFVISNELIWTWSEKQHITSTN